MKKNQTKSTTNKSAKTFYAFGTYKPNKNAVPVNYKGTEYLSKAQCMALEGITRKELDAYLNGQEESIITSLDTAEKVAEEETYTEPEMSVEDDIEQDLLSEQADSLDDLLK